LIKLVRTVTSYQDGGYYAAVVYSGTNFNLLNPFIPLDALATDTYDVYTTTGTFQRVTSDAATAGSNKPSTLFGSGQRYVATTRQGLQVTATTGWSGNLACEGLSTSDATNFVPHCINHGDLFTVLAPVASRVNNPPYINLYKATRVWTTPYTYSGSDNTLVAAGAVNGMAELQRGIHIIETDLTLNWGSDDTSILFNVYKFVPATASSYTYVAPCSNRGICNEETGVCQCFPGYTSDSCSVQNSLAL